jgi:hypothetical protein
MWGNLYINYIKESIIIIIINAYSNYNLFICICIL